jgi:PadR family transcriptional regulator AphA
MDYRIIEYGGIEILELDEKSRITSEADALDCVAACGDEGTSLLLLNEANLTDNFYRLRTGLAGAVLQRFAVYRLRTAIVLSPLRANQGRFREMVLEANRGKQLGFYEKREQALEWFRHG